MTSDGAPDLSVVVATDVFDTIREVVACLGEQSLHDRLELVVVTSSAADVAVPDEIDGRFRAVRVVEVGEESFAELPRARAEGVRAASAPVVVFGETHSFPEPGWAEALLEAHRGPWAAVGPVMLNANPRTAISRANLLVDFGPWVDRREAGPMPDLPGHNTAYKRDLLLARGPRLGELLASETLLNLELSKAGHRLYFQPAARTRHLNLTGVFWLLERFDHDRLWAVTRARRWSWLRRLLYVAGAPLIPAVRLKRVLPEVRRTGGGRDLPLLVMVVLGLVAGALGELAGYAVRRAGSSARRMHDVELHRERYARDPRAAHGAIPR
jgi:hypothetical protein